MSMTTDKFIQQIAPIAIRQAAKHGNKLFPSVCIAQGAQESGWGTTKRMIEANALFGVKVGESAWKFGTAWDGAAYKTGTTEYYDGVNPTKITDYFRKYLSIEKSVEDYMDMLCHCQRYKKAVNCKTPEESMRAIAAAGYATGPNYAEHVIAIINDSKYNLKQYDKQPDIKKVDYFVKITAKPSLFLRSSYSTASIPVLPKGLPEGMILKITHECEGWGKVGDIDGWVSLEYTKKI